MSVIVAHDKYGTFLYESATTLLLERVEQGYWYDNWDDGNPRHQWGDRAKKLAKRADEGEDIEADAWAFLRSRRDFEYEEVEEQDVR